MTEVFERERGRLLSVAYGILGSIADAEDVVQETWLRSQKAGAEVRTPEAWLTTVVSRLALDKLKSAQTKRETYPGVWLPEPVADTPAYEEMRWRETRLSLAFLHLMEKLGPEERALFVLREVFDRPYSEIAEIIGKSEAACRQMMVRAKARLEREPAERRTEVPEQVIDSLIAALSAGDERGLMNLIAPEAVLYSDGGGKAPAAIQPIRGSDRIVRFFLGLMQKFPGRHSGTRIRANGQPAVLVKSADRIYLMALTAAEGRIVELSIVGNPDKLNGFMVPAAADSVQSGK